MIKINKKMTIIQKKIMISKLNMKMKRIKMIKKIPIIMKNMQISKLKLTLKNNYQKNNNKEIK